MLLNRPFWLLLFSICTESVRAAGERELAILKSERLLLRRPNVNIPSGLDQRDGLTPNETKNLIPVIGVLELKKVEVAAREFWRAPIVKTLAGLYRKQRNGLVDQDDEWISWTSETSPDDELDINARKESTGRSLIFLSQTGFRRLETSVELTVASGRDLLGHVPVADFCETRPGRDLPVDFSARFSPWDFGAGLASSTRLEAALMDLALQPDPFDTDDSEETYDDAVQTVIDDEALPDDEDGWQGVLARFDDRMKKGELSLAEFTAKIRNDQTLSKPIKRFVLAAAVTSVELKKTCSLRSGIWSEMILHRDQTLDFFACRSASGKVLGSKLTVEGGDLEEGQIIFSSRAGPVEFVGSIAADTSALRVSTILSGTNIGWEYLFGADGMVRASRDLSHLDGLWFFFDNKKNLEFAQGLSADNVHKAVGFYSDGQLRGFSHIDVAGKVDYIATFYASGQPRSYLPMNDGHQDGTMYWWHSSGQLAGELTFASGRRFGAGRLIYPNGIEGFRADYAEDRPHGRMIWRDPAGHIVFSLGYVGGKAHGAMEIRFAGRLIGNARFEGGAVEGAITLRNFRGGSVAEIPYKGGLLNGEVIFRDAGGIIRAKSQWLDGQAHGTTEAYYASGSLASRCEFSKGKLLNWLSRRPDGHTRYRGTSKEDSSGSADIEFYGGTNAPIIDCKAKEWRIEQCATAGKAGALAPETKALALRIGEPGDLQFKPERCGGAVRIMDVTRIVDQPQGEVSIVYRVKELCRGADLATGMHCDVLFNGKQWPIKSCVLTDD